jgi:hypothetical protein
VDRFLRQAEEILDTAIASDDSPADFVILFDRHGGMRMMEAAGWSAAALRAEFGAAAFYRIEHSSDAVRVEGWQGSQRCLFERKRGPARLSDLPGMCQTGYATMLQVARTPLVGSNERSPQVLNS